MKYKSSKRNYKKPEPTYEQCFKAAQKYAKVKKFNNHDTTLYKAAKKNGWFNDYYWFVSVQRYWTFERCESEARKYDTIVDFEKNCYGSYHIAEKQKWLSKFDWLK